MHGRVLHRSDRNADADANCHPEPEPDLLAYDYVHTIADGKPSGPAVWFFSVPWGRGLRA